jgi:hypothetical protein
VRYFRFVFGSYLISWPIWFYASHFRGVVHFEMLGWTSDIPLQTMVQLLGNLGTGLAATVVVFLTEGWLGVEQLWGGLKNWRLNPVWLIFVFLLVPILDSLALFSYWCFGGKVAAIGSPTHLLLLIVLNLPFAPLWEEVGWRGSFCRNWKLGIADYVQA